jgi:hypothetical protein
VSNGPERSHKPSMTCNNCGRSAAL